MSPTRSTRVCELSLGPEDCVRAMGNDDAYPSREARAIFLTADTVSDRVRPFVGAVHPGVVSKPISAADLEGALEPLLRGEPRSA